VFDGQRFAHLDVALEDDRIVAVGADLQPGAADSTWDLRGDLLLPGLVNAHYHSPDNLATGRLPSAPLELWSLASVPSRTSDPADLRVAALFGAAQLLLGGVTAVIDMVRPSPRLTRAGLEAVADAYLASGMRAAVVPVVRDLPVEETMPLGPGAPTVTPELDAHEQLSVVRDFFHAWHGRDGRLQVQVGPSGPQRCSDQLFDGALDLAAELGTMLHTHVLETRAQAIQGLRRWGRSVLRHLYDMGALSQRAALAHVVWPEPDEMDLLATSEAVVVHNPASNCALGSGRAPLPDMLAAGVRLALGTDAATCNDGLSVFEAMKLAAIVHRPHEADWRRWPTAADTLAMGTRGGAQALGLPDQLGHIAPGYLADLVVLDARCPAFVPPNDIPRQVVMRAGPEVVRHVFVGGRPVVRDRKLLTVDADRLAEDASGTGLRQARPTPPSEKLVGAVEGMLREVRNA
jgi:5-methylthioadenosine/S-adenosylhomocysteine deaminase